MFPYRERSLTCNLATSLHGYLKGGGGGGHKAYMLWDMQAQDKEEYSPPPARVWTFLDLTLVLVWLPQSHVFPIEQDPRALIHRSSK